MLGELQNVIVLAAPFFVCKGCVGMRIRRFKAVVNRHSTDLSYDKQLFLYMKYLVFCCELLSNLYLCPMTNNVVWWIINVHTVVNCFQICIFVL